MNLQFQRRELFLADTWSISKRPGTRSRSVVEVMLSGSDGHFGLGEAAPVARYNESIESVEAFLRRIAPNDLSVNDIASSLDCISRLSPGDASAKCALDVALLDAASRRARKPLCDFLDLGFAEGQHITSFTIGIDTPAVVRKKVLAAREFPILKLKMGVPEDKANFAALRETAPNKLVRADANEGWTTKEEALRMIEWLAADGRVQLVEQPMPASAPDQDWSWLKVRSPLPIFADESYRRAGDAQRAAHCFHGVNVKLSKAGGIAAAAEALRAARRLGLKTMLGCMIETSLLISAAAHLAELCDYVDLDGNLLITNDPYAGVTADGGILSFAGAVEATGLRISNR